MSRVIRQVDLSGITLDALGQRMGYSQATARKSAWQFLQKTNDPRISMLRKFARAMKISLSDLVSSR
jgi:hypothetical protein